MKKYLLFFLLLIAIKHLFPQVNQEWVRRYNSLSSGDGARTKAIAIDSSGNIYVAGQDAGYDIVLLKYNSSGTQLWVKYASFGGAEINYMAVDIYGDVYLAGKNSGLFLVKYHRGGVKLWDRTYQGDYYSEANGLVITPSGYPIVAGTIRKDDYTKEDYCAIKYTSNGDSVWTRIYNSGGNNRDEATSLALALDGSICISGSRWNSATGMNHSYLTVKYDSSGNFKWSNLYGSPDSNYYAENSVFDKLGNIHITGTLMPGIYQTVKYNKNGVLIWSKEYSVSAPSTAKKIKVDRLGNAIVSGSSSATSMSGPFITTIEYDSTGTRKWVKYFSEMNDSTTVLGSGNSMALDNSGNIYLTGNYLMRNWPPPAMYGMFTMKYNSGGSIGWIKEYYGNRCYDGGIALVIDKYNNVYSTGITADTVLSNGIITIKYSQTSGIKQINNNIPEKCFLFQNYPNPFNQCAIINVQLSIACQLEIKVYDLLGKEVAILTNERKRPGSYEVIFDAGNLSSGVYFYSLFINEMKIDTKKLVIIK